MQKLCKIVLMCATLAALTAGCATRQESAAMRWQEKLAVAQLHAAREALAEGRYDLARRLLEQCLQADPDNTQAQQLYVQAKTADALYAQLTYAKNQKSF